MGIAKYRLGDLFERKRATIGLVYLFPETAKTNDPNQNLDKVGGDNCTINK